MALGGWCAWKAFSPSRSSPTISPSRGGSSVTPSTCCAERLRVADLLKGLSQASAHPSTSHATGLEIDLRLDGRSHAEIRPTAIEVGVIRQASGSARCSMGSTDVIVAVKAEVGVPTEDAPDCGGFQLSVEYSTCANAEDVEEMAARLSAALDRSLRGSLTGQGGALNLQDLCILPGKHCWVLCIDALVLSAAGNVMDALSLASKAALADTRIPLVEITATEVADDEPELDVDDDLTHARRLDVSSIPLTTTVNQVGQMVALDCSLEEESCSIAAVHISTDEHGNICSILKSGTGAVRTSLLPDMMYLAQQRSKGLLAAHAAFVKRKAA